MICVIKVLNGLIINMQYDRLMCKCREQCRFQLINHIMIQFYKNKRKSQQYKLLELNSCLMPIFALNNTSSVL